MNGAPLPPQALEFASLDRIRLTHIRGNPLIRKDMAKHVDISRSVALACIVQLHQLAQLMAHLASRRSAEHGVMMAPVN